MTGELLPLPERLAWALRSDSGVGAGGPEVIEVTVREEGRPATAVVRLTARQAWWLCVRLGANRPLTEDEEQQRGGTK